MKAIAISAYGGRDQLKLVDMPRPEPAADEILIHVKSAGVNPVDYKIREGYLKDFLPHAFPIILGWDAAGVVAAVGHKVRRFSEGDEVFAYCRKPTVQHGAYAEYIVLKDEHVAHKPKNATFGEAASIPLAGLTAYQALFDAARLKEGETVLIHAAAGGVGGFAVQLAKNAKAHVIGTASTPNHEYVHVLGAHEVIDYRLVDFRTAVKQRFPNGVDVVFDCVGGETQKRSVEVLRKGGRLVSIVDVPDDKHLEHQGIQAKYVFVAPNTKQLEILAHQFEAIQLKTFISGVFPLEGAANAHEKIESHRTIGKIVLSV